MTELLKDLLHDRADSLDAPDLDVLRMVRDGNRRVARRKARLICAGVAASVVVMAGVVAIPQLLPAQESVVDESFAAAFTTHEPAFAIGSEVHIDGRSFDAGHPVRAFVQTTTGVVFTDDVGAVWSSDGTVTDQIGRTDAVEPQLKADGSRVAWVQPDAETGAPVFTSYDQATDQTTQTAYEVRGGASEYSPAMFAVDGDEVWFRDDRGAVRWNVTTGQQTEEGAPVGLEIDDVKAQMIAHRLPMADSGGMWVDFGETFGELISEDFHKTLALSPDGTTALGESDPEVPALADTATGAVTPITVPGYGFFVGYGWIDDDTYVGLGRNDPAGSTPVDLLECEVGGACTVAAEAVGTFDGGLVLPVGEKMTP